MGKGKIKGESREDKIRRFGAKISEEKLTDAETNDNDGKWGNGNKDNCDNDTGNENDKINNSP